MLSYSQIRHAREIYILTNSFSKPWSQPDKGCSFCSTPSLCELFMFRFFFSLWAVHFLPLFLFVSCYDYISLHLFVSCLYFSLWAVYNYILLHLFFVSCWYIATPCLCERRLFLETNCNCVNVALFVLIPKTFVFCNKENNEPFMNLLWKYVQEFDLNVRCCMIF